MTQKLIGAFSVVFVLLFSLSSCSTQEKSNSSNIDKYLSTLYSDEEALISNNYSVFEDKDSFEVAFDSFGNIFGDKTDADKINWGLTSKFQTPACEFENFWGASTRTLSVSPEIVGMATKLNSISMTVENFNKSNFGVLIQNVLSFKSSEVAENYFSNIDASLDRCSKNVEIFDLGGDKTTAPFTNLESAQIRFLKPSSQSIARVAEDGLIHLQVYVLTKYSIVNFEIIINDLTSANQSDWAPLNAVINASLSRICTLEECAYTPISIENSENYNPIDGALVPIKL